MTMSFSIFSSSAMNWDSWLGSVIWILASISVFLTSKGASIRAILASLTTLGMLGWTGSLSMMSPLTM